MSETQHTQGIWEIGEDGDIFCEGACIAKICGAPDGIKEAKANAAFIVLACNEHAKLKADRKALLEACKEMIHHLDEDDESKCMMWCQLLLENAVALAETGNPIADDLKEECRKRMKESPAFQAAIALAEKKV